MIEIEFPLESFKEFPGPILLLASPGTGKTYQIEKRVEFLINKKNITPNEIAIITFTVAAARNMRSRLIKFKHNIPSNKIPNIITTMHSYANSIIGRFPNYFGLPDEYGILSDKCQREVIMQDAEILAGIKGDVWKMTNECKTKGTCEINEDQEKCKVCNKYSEILRKCELIDYDDQILLACKLLRENTEFAVEIKKSTKHLLVDEYQDINKAQFEFIKLLSEGQESGLFVVGDDDQSIYSFRGGDPKYIINFEEYYGKITKIGRLSVSFRCPEKILLGARKVVEKFYPGRVPKPDLSFSEDIKINNKIVLYNFPSEKYEAAEIASISEKAIKQTRKVIIIIPSKNYFPLIRDALIKKKINYIYKTSPSDEGLIRFEILINWANSKHDNALLRHLLQFIVMNNDCIINLIPTSTSGIVNKRNEVTKYLASLWNEISQNNNLYSLICDRSNNIEKYPIENIIKEKCLDIIEDYIVGKNSGKRKALPDFLNTAGLMVAPGKNPKGFIAEIENWILELKASSIGGTYLPVEIYNMPSSKGLEAEVVCVVGLSKGIFPAENDDIQEKARLAYVAMTRAQEELYLFSCRTRSGGRTYSKESYQLEPSQFLEEIGEEYLERKIVYYNK